MALKPLPTLMVCGLAAGLGFADVLKRGQLAHANDHYRHVHVHHHDGHAHTHWHSHHVHQEHPANDYGGDHHDRMSGEHGDPVPIILTAAPRQTRRLGEINVVTAAIPEMGRIEPVAVGPTAPKRPPRHSKTENTLSQLRTIVLLT